MLIALLLLAVLTIGAVSASDDVALDNVTASDEGDAVAVPQDDELGEMDESDVDIYVEEDVSKEDTSNNFTYVGVTEEDGNFVIRTGEGENTVELYRENLSTSGRGVFDTDDGCYYYGVSLNDINGYIAANVNQSKNFYDLVEPNQIVRFVFEYMGSDLVIDPYVVDYNDENITFSEFTYVDEGDDVNITIAEGFDFKLPEDIDEAFASVSVPDGLKGFITIYVEDEDYLKYYFYKPIDEMEGVPGENCTIYGVTLKMLNGYEQFVEEESFTISFIDEDEDDEIASVECGIDYDDENNTVRFSKIEELAGEGEDLTESLGVYIAEEANAVPDGVIISIQVSVFEGVEVYDNFTVYILDDEREVTLNLTNLCEHGEFYVISVSDLFEMDDLDDMGSDYSFLVQFYDDGGEGNYYIETEDVTIYANPYIYGKVNAYNDDWVISFTEIEDADDEFKVTISQDGHEDIVKTFKISELENMAEDDDEDPYYVLKCSDLNLTVPGEYGITVNFTEDGEELIYNIRLVNVSNELDIRAPEDGESFDNVQDQIFIVQVDEDFDGYVKVFVNGTQVGEEIPLVDLGWSMGPLGREIVLNDFNITESGNYTLKVEVYDENDTFINNATADVEVTVGENSVKFNDAYYTQDTYMIFDLRTPVDGIFLISLNGIEAGYYNPAGHDIYWYDNFVDVWLDNENARFLKVGNYKVNITLWDYNHTKTPFKNGSFSILSMNATADKGICLEGDNVTITFDGKYYPGKPAKLEVTLIKSWSPMGPEDEVIAVFDDDDLDEMYDGKGSFSFTTNKIPVGENMIILHYMVADNKIDLLNGEYTVDASDAVGVDVVTNPVDPALTIAIANITEGNPAVVTITTNAIFSGNVTVTIANKNYTVSVVNGKGTINVAGLAANTYTATAIFAASGIFAYSEKTTSFTVAKKPVTPAKKADKIKLTLKKVKVKKSAKKLVLRATLKINGKAAKGKKIIFKFKGKKYKAKTNKKGVAKVTIKKKVLKKLKVGKKVKYQATYGKVTKKYTVKVKK